MKPNQISEPAVKSVDSKPEPTAAEPPVQTGATKTSTQGIEADPSSTAAETNDSASSGAAAVSTSADVNGTETVKTTEPGAETGSNQVNGNAVEKTGECAEPPAATLDQPGVSQNTSPAAELAYTADHSAPVEPLSATEPAQRKTSSGPTDVSAASAPAGCTPSADVINRTSASDAGADPKTSDDPSATATATEEPTATTATTAAAAPEPTDTTADDAEGGDSDPEFDPRKAQFQYGNYNRYYGYRNGGGPDARLGCLRAEWFCGLDVLDVGCNIGHVTLTVARDHAPRRCVGLDIDSSLIKVRSGEGVEWWRGWVVRHDNRRS